MSKIGDFVRKRHSLSVLDIIHFAVNFTIVYVVFAGSLYLSKRLDLPPDGELTLAQWGIILFGSIPLVAFTYVRELVITRRKERQIKERKLTYDCIGGAIEQLIEIKTRSLDVRIHYITELLKYVEKVVFLVLREYGISTGEICANLMQKRENPPRLELTYFGTFLSGRKKITLSLSPKEMAPGAPEAYCYRKTMYVDNTTSDKYRRFFDQTRPYKCIISIPVLDSEGEPFAILNIDSDIPNQFVGKDFIDKKIMPTINPLVRLLILEKDLIVNNK